MAEGTFPGSHYTGDGNQISSHFSLYLCNGQLGASISNAILNPPTRAAGRAAAFQPEN